MTGGFMKRFTWFKRFGMAATYTACILIIPNTSAAASDPVHMLYDFQATGQFVSFDPYTGKSTYSISAVGKAPKVTGNGIVKPRVGDDDAYTVVLSNALITFDAFNPANPDPIVNFTCEGCTLAYPDGSILTSDPSVPLQGRAFFLYGPVAPQANSSIITIRMAGCSGLRETAGVGSLANKVGSICFNGSFDFDQNNPAVIKGESNCTIVAHTPVRQQ
jgi:hypothetical protein